MPVISLIRVIAWQVSLRILICLLGLLIIAQRAQASCDDTAGRVSIRELDWWLGKWTVYAGETKTADTVIERREGGCAVLESWSSVPSNPPFNRPNQSSALISFDSDTQRWEYFWVTAITGEHLHFIARPQRDLVWLRTTRSRLHGLSVQEVTFTRRADGTLREWGRTRTDENRTWTTDYEFIWKREEPAAK